MKAIITSKNFPSITKDLIITARDSELLLITGDGDEIASITIAIADSDEKDEKGKYKPSDSYFVSFNISPSCSKLDNNLALVHPKKTEN